MGSLEHQPFSAHFFPKPFRSICSATYSCWGAGKLLAILSPTHAVLALALRYRYTRGQPKKRIPSNIYFPLPECLDDRGLSKLKSTYPFVTCVGNYSLALWRTRVTLTWTKSCARKETILPQSWKVVESLASWRQSKRFGQKRAGGKKKKRFWPFSLDPRFFPVSSSIFFSLDADLIRSGERTQTHARTHVRTNASECVMLLSFLQSFWDRRWCFCWWPQLPGISWAEHWWFPIGERAWGEKKSDEANLASSSVPHLLCSSTTRSQMGGINFWLLTQSFYALRWTDSVEQRSKNLHVEKKQLSSCQFPFYLSIRRTFRIFFKRKCLEWN